MFTQIATPIGATSVPVSGKKFKKVCVFSTKMLFQSNFFGAKNQYEETFCKKFSPKLPFQNILLDTQTSISTDINHPVTAISFLAIGFYYVTIREHALDHRILARKINGVYDALSTSANVIRSRCEYDEFVLSIEKKRRAKARRFCFLIPYST
ncbi:MAG: hypothetical protein PHE53_06040 [Thermoguttaceae bacterium]|nr:hypothetical protein [Thermoguttaceae bacterium]